MAVDVVGISLGAQGMELLVVAPEEKRQGLTMAHSYFIEYKGEHYGQRAKDLMEEIEDLAEDVHLGWKREPKVESE
jgi:hypothetical protein